MFRTVLAAVAAMSFAAPSSAAPVFLLNDTGGVGEGTQARAGFEAAAALWSQLFTDDVVIRLDVGFRAMSGGVIGQTGSAKSRMAYTALRDALAKDVSSFDDAISAATLHVRPDLRFVSNEAGNCTTGWGCSAADPDSRTIDRDLTYDNRYVSVNTTQWKALGLIDDTLMRDAAITFSSGSRWDFDGSDGIRSGHYDFVGVAAHEIGHALGFSSGVDTADGRMGQVGLDEVAWGSVLDLFRFDAGLRSWAVGGAPCLSLDRGLTCRGSFATGARHGDGRQASHWKDGRGLGLMDPSASAGSVMRINARDALAFDVIGWDLAPSPSDGGAVRWTDFASTDTTGEWESETILAEVPAPPALALFGLGLVWLARRRSV